MVAKVEAVIICLLILIMDVMAGILGLEAEKVQNQGRHLRILFIECKQPVHLAHRLGIAGATLLALSHIIANLLGGCTCICSSVDIAQSTANRLMAAITLILSWIILAISFTLLIIGSLSNSKSRASCGFRYKHFLSIGGILCFVHAVICLMYYVSANAAKRDQEILKPQNKNLSHGGQP